MSKIQLRSVNLRQIATVDFRKNERTCWLEFVKKNPRFTLNSGDALLLLSKSFNQLCFVYGTTELRGTVSGLDSEVLTSLKLRISGGTWNPLRLSEYANSVGLELIGIKSFAQRSEELV